MKPDHHCHKFTWLRSITSPYTVILLNTATALIIKPPLLHYLMKYCHIIVNFKINNFTDIVTVTAIHEMTLNDDMMASRVPMAHTVLAPLSSTSRALRVVSNHSPFFHLSPRLCPSTAVCSPPSMPSIVLCLLLSCFTFHLGFVHPLQYVALHQCLPLSSVCCFPVPGGSPLPCYVILPSCAWSFSWSLPSPWLPLCAAFGPLIVLHSCYMSGPSLLLFQCVFYNTLSCTQKCQNFTFITNAPLLFTS